MPLKTEFEEVPQLNMTPMIDCVFLLLIFFMVGARFTEMERKIGLQVPQVNDVGALAPVPEKRVISVFRDGHVEFDRQTVTLDQLGQQLAAARAEYDKIGVIVRGDGEGAFQHVASVLAACRQAGIADLGISVRLAKKER